MSDLLIKKFDGFVRAFDSPSFLDLIIHNLIWRDNDSLREFKRSFVYFMFNCFIDFDIKVQLGRSLCKNLFWVNESFEDLQFQVLETSSMMRHICSTDLLNYSIGLILSDRVLVNGESYSKSIHIHCVLFKDYLDSLNNSVFADRECAESFVACGNWDILAHLSSHFERMMNDRFDEYMSTNYQGSIYDRHLDILSQVVFEHLSGILRIEDHNAHQALLRRMEVLLFRELVKIEKSANQGNTDSYGPFRLGFVQRYLALVLFTNYFVASEDGSLMLSKHSISEDVRKKFRESLKIDKAEKMEFYRNILRNYLFFLQRICNVKRKYPDQVYIHRKYKSNRFYELLFKCLFFLDPDFGPVACRVIKAEFASVVEQQELSPQTLKYMQNAFNFLLEITLDDNLFEEFYCVLSFNFGLDDLNLLSRAQLEVLQRNVPGIVERLKVIVAFKSLCGVNEVNSSIEFPYENNRVPSQFREFLFETNFRFEKKSKKFKLPKSGQKQLFYQNLLYLEEQLLEDIKLDLRNQKVKTRQIHLYYWHNDRMFQALDFLKAAHLSAWMVPLYHRLRSLLSAGAEPRETAVFPASDLLAELILIDSQVTDRKSIIESFFSQIYKFSGKSIKTLLKAMIKKYNYKPSESMKNALQSQIFLEQSESQSRKSRAQRLLRKIKKKTKTPKTIDKAPIEPVTESDVCLRCNEPFDAQNPFVLIIKVHHYQPDRLLSEEPHPDEPYHIFTSCGHKHHLDCLASDLGCLLCKAKGQLVFAPYVNEKIDQLQMNMFNHAMSKIFDDIDFYRLIVYPLLQCVRMLKIISFDHLKKNILPGLRMLFKMINYKFDLANDAVFAESAKSHNDSIQKKMLQISATADESFDLILDGVCVEMFFAKTVIYAFLHKLETESIESENAESNLIKNKLLLQDLIQEHLWKFVVFKILQASPLSFADVNMEMISAQCYDLLQVVMLLEHVLDPTGADSGLDLNTLGPRIQGRRSVVLIRRIGIQVQNLGVD